jgi:hypothetical protein
MPRINKIGVTALALVLMLLSAFSSMAQDGATLRLDEQPLRLGEEQRIPLAIICEPIFCSSIRLTLRYDPTVLELRDVLWGDYLGSRDNFIAFDPVIDPALGSLTLDILIYADAGLDAEGSLIELVVMPLQAATSLVYIESVVITSVASANTPVSITPTIIEIAAPTATATLEPSITATATASPTETPTATTTPTATATLASTIAATEIVPCLAILFETEIYVGPARNRTIRGLLSDRTLPVGGQYLADDGTLWWRLIWPAPPIGEADRFWIIAEDVESTGDCDALPEILPSAILTPSGPPTATALPTAIPVTPATSAPSSGGEQSRPDTPTPTPSPVVTPTDTPVPLLPLEVVPSLIPGLGGG